MIRKFTTILLSLLALVWLASSIVPHTLAAPDALVGENHKSVEYDFWHVWQDPDYTNGVAHGTWLKDSTAEFHFSGTAIAWVTAKGNPMGKAQVLIDGVDKGTFDLYSAIAKNKQLLQFRGLSIGSHVIKINVLGEKNPAAVSSYVFVDGFVVNGTLVENNSPAIKYNSWRGQKNVNATGGTFRATRTPDATAKFVFTGTGAAWITAKGPAYGKAEVLLDGVSQGVVDLYAPNQKWQVMRKFNGLANAQHSLEIRVLGLKNPAATNSVVVVDGFAFQ